MNDDKKFMYVPKYIFVFLSVSIWSKIIGKQCPYEDF